MKKTKNKKHFKKKSKKQKTKKKKFIKKNKVGGFLNENLTLDNYVDKIFIINLDSRPDRMKNIEDNLKKNNIKNYERFSAIKVNPNEINIGDYSNMYRQTKGYIIGSVGCRNSHLGVIKLAKQRNYSRILILEDDMTFKKNYLTIFRKCINQCLKNNIDYDMLLLYYNLFKPYKYISDNLIKVSKALSGVAYILTSKIFDKILNECEKYNIEIDTYYTKYIQSNNNSYCINPQIAEHPKGDVYDSDINSNFS